MRFPGPKTALLVVAMAAAAVALPVLAVKPDAGATTSQAGVADIGAADVYCSTAGSQATKVMPWQPGGYLDAEDTSKTLQRLINSASSSGGAIVQLPEGVFLLDRPLLVKSNVALKGSGPGTVLKASPGFLASKGPFGGHPLITTNGAQNVTIADLTADHSGDELDGDTPGRLTEYLVDVRNSSNALVEGVGTRNPFTYSIAVNSLTDIPGAWLDFHGELRDISVSDNSTCRTGGMKLADGASSFEANNRKAC